VFELPEDRLAEAAGVLTRSFLTNPNFVNLFSDEEVRARALAHVPRACLRDALRAGHVYAANRGGEIVGVAAWLPPGWFPLSVRRQLRAAPDIARIFRAAPRSLGRLLRFTSGLAKLHPAQPHWYLEAVGVEPGAQGMGIGTRLLEPVLARVDEEGQPCYLETMTERNVAWYRRLGFEVRSAGVTFTRGGPPNWTMLRRPGATVGGTRSNGGGGVP
jgi:ribosomal protein S18 acetylase RimI-like enzyme